MLLGDFLAFLGFSDKGLLNSQTCEDNRSLMMRYFVPFLKGLSGYFSVSKKFWFALQFGLQIISGDLSLLKLDVLQEDMH